MRVTAAALLFLASLPALAHPRVEHEFSTAVSTGSARRVIVDIPSGEVHVRNGEPGRVSISGTVSREPDRSRNSPAEQRIVDDSSAAMAVRGDDVTIFRAFGPNARSWRAETFSSWNVIVEVPAGMHVDVRTRYGVVEVEGTFGDIDVDLRAGEIGLRIPRPGVRELRASCLAGEVRTDLGDEVITRQGLLPGKTRYENAAGTSSVNLHTSFGGIHVDLID